MNGITLSAALCISLLASSTVLAEDLVETYAKAQRNDPAIREAEANMLAEIEIRPQARSLLLPNLSASGGGQLNRSEGSSSRPVSIPDPSSPGDFLTDVRNVETEQDADSLNWSVDLRQTLFDLEVWRQLKKSNKEVAQAQANYSAAEQDLIIRVSEAYFNVLAAQDTLTAERASKEAIQRQLEQAERRFEVGLIAITDVKESQAAFDDSVAVEIEARRTVASAKEALREITGEYPGTLSAPGTEFRLVAPEPAVEQDWVDVSLQQNLALESARLNTEITRANIEIERAGHTPTLELTGSIGNRRVRGDTTTFDGLGSGGRVSDLDTDNDQKSIGIQLSVPIFSGGGTSSRVRQAVYRHRAARENYEKTARSTEREARDTYLGVIAEIARVQALARSVESNQTALEATEAGYNVGTRTTVDVLNARESLFRAQTRYARSKYDYLINVLKLKLATGTLNGSDVGEINNWLVVSEQLERIPGRGGEPDAELEESSVPTRPDAQSDQS